MIDVLQLITCFKSDIRKTYYQYHNYLYKYITTFYGKQYIQKYIEDRYGDNIVQYLTAEGIKLLLQDNDRVITAWRSSMTQRDREWLGSQFKCIPITGIIETIGILLTIIDTHILIVQINN